MEPGHGRNTELSLLYDLSGDSDAWMSTGLYLLEGQSAEISISEAAASGGLKVRLHTQNQHLPKHSQDSSSQHSCLCLSN